MSAAFDTFLGASREGSRSHCSLVYKNSGRFTHIPPLLLAGAIHHRRFAFGDKPAIASSLAAEQSPLLQPRSYNLQMPTLEDLKETSLYVENLERAKEFYQGVLGLRTLVDEERFCALDVAAKHILLLFVRGASLRETHLSGGTIPAHDGTGPLHVAFAVTSQELPQWDSHLHSKGVEILSRVSWPKGGQSIYFRDPDGHLLELLTPGVWATY